MKRLLEKLEYGVSPRETLSSIADQLGGMLPIEVEEYHIPLMNYVPAYFESKDSKIRKNAARVIGFLNDPLVPSILIRAYQAEETLYVRPAYLKALRNCAIDEPVAEILKARKAEILGADIPAEERKHYNEELGMIEECLKSVPTAAQRFIGYEMENDVLFVTDRVFRDLTDSFLTEKRKKLLPSGIFLRTDRLREFVPIRTYREVLFSIPGLNFVSEDPYAAARQLIEGGILRYLYDRHDGDGPFPYRLELRALDEKKAPVLIKRISGEILRLSEGQLVMRKDRYELELRFIQREDGQFRFFLKLFTMEDERFSYRKEAVAASIKPVTAAAFLKKYESYLKKDAQVLDPFCGVGTMLFERNLLCPVRAAFGVDTFGEAIDKARRNGNESQYPIYFIHRDFFDFRHDSLFDEIVTDMPFAAREEDEAKIAAIYDRFFVKAKEMLIYGGYILMLARNPEHVRRNASGLFRIEETMPINEKTGLTGFVLKKL